MGELKYRKAFDTLRSEILSGKYASRKSFPSIVATCSRFKISRLTAVKALDKLKDEGLISTRVGAGTFVTKDARSRFIGLVVRGSTGGFVRSAGVGKRNRRRNRN